jgi:predicted Rossmann fold nucleotide-binding protein DprA/Smf involved in DNA uptake
MQRNRTISALSRTLVLIEARATGGTFAAGEAALAMGLPLFTADYSTQLESNDGNRILLERGPFAYARAARREGRTLRNCSQWRVSRVRGRASVRARASDSRICLRGEGGRRVAKPPKGHSKLDQLPARKPRMGYSSG